VLGGNKCVPCPEQCSYEEHPVQCVDCLLCTKDQMLRERGLTIAFHAHGRKSEQLRASLQAIGQSGSQSPTKPERKPMPYTFQDLEFFPHRAASRPFPGTVQGLLTFPNGWGVSVVGGPAGCALYGNAIDRREVGVISPDPNYRNPLLAINP
jgi:hypothetical protein